MQPVPIDAHRAPDPVPVEEEPAEPFDNPHPHHPPVHPPSGDEEPVPNHNPSTGRARLRHAAH